MSDPISAKAEAQADRSYRGRVVESVVGAHLHNTDTPDCRLHYWGDGTDEVNFVLERGQWLVSIEVKSGAVPTQLRGFAAFKREFGACLHLLIGDGGIPLAEFLSYPAGHWF